MHVSSGLPHMLVSNQRGRGHEPVTVAGSIRFFVTVKAMRWRISPQTNVGLRPTPRLGRSRGPLRPAPLRRRRAVRA